MFKLKLQKCGQGTYFYIIPKRSLYQISSPVNKPLHFEIIRNQAHDMIMNGISDEFKMALVSLPEVMIGVCFMHVLRRLGVGRAEKNFRVGIF